jgi:hypothetical protein
MHKLSLTMDGSMPLVHVAHRAGPFVHEAREIERVGGGYLSRSVPARAACAAASRATGTRNGEHDT